MTKTPEKYPQRAFRLSTRHHQVLLTVQRSAKEIIKIFNFTLVCDIFYIYRWIQELFRPIETIAQINTMALR